MKLLIGENIRNFRKKNDLTQEELANRLGVTYQSVSRWENGSTYPDLELLPAISEVLEVTVDELLGMPQAEKEKRALETYDQLRRECMKSDYDVDAIISLIRDIRRNYMKSEHAWRPWVEGNDNAFRDPKILPEVRLMADEYLKLNFMSPHVLQTMARIESDENIKEFLEKHTTCFDCSERALLFNRYLYKGDREKFELERHYQLHNAFSHLLCPRYFLKLDEDEHAADDFMEKILSLIRADAKDDKPDMWIEDRMELGLKSAIRLIKNNNKEMALEKVTTAVKLLEETMSITDEVSLPVSCRFLEGMKWSAKEDWQTPSNDPDDKEERIIFICTHISNICRCYCIFPRRYYKMLQSTGFKALQDNPEFINLCERVKALIIERNPSEKNIET
ncbi:MAG: helix-turn-helix transcriptional regulator [Clostridia bacterium]|nr:helix-turn-helix transcriptional regulator [Clostridia bacterium]